MTTPITSFLLALAAFFGATHHSASATVTGQTHRATPVAAHGSPPHVSGYGDSVMLGAKQRMLDTFGGRVNAVESRQASETLAAVRADVSRDRLNPLVVIHVGTNGTMSGRDLRHTLRQVAGVARVKLIEVLTVHVPRSWQRPNNAIIRRVVPQVSKAVVAPWRRAAHRHPGWLYSDGVHLTPAGQYGYTHLIEVRSRRG